MSKANIDFDKAMLKLALKSFEKKVYDERIFDINRQLKYFKGPKRAWLNIKLIRELEHLKDAIIESHKK